MQHPILSMVKRVCRSYGVRFVMARSVGTSMGTFSESERTLTIYTKWQRTRGRRRGKPRVQVSRRHDILMTAIHEMTHMLQWKRKDPNWHMRTPDGRKRLDDVIFDYLLGENECTDASLLFKSAMALSRLEFEAEIMSLRIMDLFGERYPRSRVIRSAKAYSYSYLVFARTGIMADKKLWAHWGRHLSNSWSYDLDDALLSRMCDIARSHRDLSYVVWEDGTCIKSNW